VLQCLLSDGLEIHDVFVHISSIRSIHNVQQQQQQQQPVSKRILIIQSVDRRERIDNNSLHHLTTVYDIYDAPTVASKINTKLDIIIQLRTTIIHYFSLLATGQEKRTGNSKASILLYITARLLVQDKDQIQRPVLLITIIGEIAGD
jgi:hypothetical protein